MEEKRLIGQRIQELRKLKGLTQEKAAERAEVSTTYLSRIECGKENPTLDMLIRLAHALDVEMWEMFDSGHLASPDEIRASLRDFEKSADEQSLRLALKLLRAVNR